MIAIIEELPDIPFSPQLLKDIQQKYLEDLKLKWRLIGRRIDYLQLRQAGYRPDDPLDSVLESGGILHPLHKAHLDVRTRVEFAFLNVLINGFDFVGDTAISEGRNFPFDDARQLFTEICRQAADDMLEPVTSLEINHGTSLNEARAVLVYLNRFYRRRLEPDQEARMLAVFRENHLWRQFSIYSVWNYCWRGKLKHYWIEFLAVYKELLQLYQDTKPHAGLKTRAIKWNAGNPVYADTSKTVLF